MAKTTAEMCFGLCDPPAASDTQGMLGRDETLRKRVRTRLRFLRHAAEFVVLNGIFVLLDWSTGGAGSGVNWAQWVALVWGICLAVEFSSVFVAPRLRGWGSEVEESLVRRELRRRQGADEELRTS
jgi:hypothetical protein